MSEKKKISYEELISAVENLNQKLPVQEEDKFYLSIATLIEGKSVKANDGKDIIKYHEVKRLFFNKQTSSGHSNYAYLIDSIMFNNLMKDEMSNLHLCNFYDELIELNKVGCSYNILDYSINEFLENLRQAKSKKQPRFEEKEEKNMINLLNYGEDELPEEKAIKRFCEPKTLLNSKKDELSAQIDPNKTDEQNLEVLQESDRPKSPLNLEGCTSDLSYISKS